MLILLKDSKIKSFKHYSLPFIIYKSLSFLRNYLPIFITYSIPLYRGEYTGVQA